MANTLQHSEWSGKTGGLPWMQRSLVALFRVLPLGLLYGVMALVVPFYMIFSRKGYQSMYRFFRDRFGYGPMKSFRKVYLNHFRFGQVILDRFGVYAGKKYRFISEEQSVFDEKETHEKGFVMLSSHVGNYEMAGYSLRPKIKRYNALVFAGETETVMENRQRILSQNNVRMVPVKDDLSHLFLLNTAIDEGEIVSMPADRIFGSQKSVECQFFGKMFVMKEGMRKYRIYLREIQYERQLSKREQMSQLSQNFAAQLEEIVRRYPTQWFNYFDFWKQ